MAMTAADLKSKIQAAYTTRTGQTMSDDALNDLTDICTGIIEEIQANAVVSVVGPDPQGGSVTSTGTVS